jgi:hypothetical protein
MERMCELVDVGMSNHQWKLSTPCRKMSASKTTFSQTSGSQKAVNVVAIPCHCADIEAGHAVNAEWVGNKQCPSERGK